MSDPLKKLPLSLAIIYAQRGWRVFPLHSVHSGDCSCGRDACSSAGKHPRTKNGVKDATTDFATIRRWWTNWPDANIGIATGLNPETGTGLHVIDIDTAKGADLASLDDLGFDDLPNLLTVRTGSGGYHLYLACDEPLPNSTNKLGPFIDTRGEGGYVVAPPSFNRQGQYTWLRPLEMVAMPPQLLEKLRGRGTTLSPFPNTSDLNEQIEKEKASHEPSNTAPQEALQENAFDTSSLSPSDAAAQEPDRLPDVSREARNDFLVKFAGVLFRHGLSISEIRHLTLLLNQERYGQGQHANGPLPVVELERTVFKSLLKWERRVQKEPHAARVASLTSLLARDTAEPLWIVPDLLPEGLTLLAGKPKIGKSWLTLSLALSVAGGYPVLGKPLAQPRDVLYLGLEDSENRLKRRALTLLADRPAPEGFYYQTAWEPLVTGGLDGLRGWLDTHPSARLVVIDTLARVRVPTGGNGSIYQEDYALMGQLRDFADEYHIALVLVHHTRKMESSDAFDTISGSTGLTGAADTSLVLTRERNQPEAVLHLTGRDVEEQTLALRFAPATGSWTLLGPTAERQHSQARQDILDLLQEKGAMTPAEVARELGKARGAVKTLLLKMAKDGSLSNDSSGRYSTEASLEINEESA